MNTINHLTTQPAWRFTDADPEREGEYVVWKEFKLESSNKVIPIGPYYFKWEDYERTIQQTLGAAKAQ